VGKRWTIFFFATQHRPRVHSKGFSSAVPLGPGVASSTITIGVPALGNFDPIFAPRRLSDGGEARDQVAGLATDELWLWPD
jgi:hypothetical protein